MSKKIHFRNISYGFELEVPDELYEIMKPLLYAKAMKFRFNHAEISGNITTVVLDEASHMNMDSIDIIQKDWMPDGEPIIVSPKD